MALDFEAGSIEYVSLPAAALSALQNVAGATLMCWANVESTSGTEHTIMQFSTGTSSSNGRATISFRDSTGFFRASGRRTDAEAVKVQDASTFGTISLAIWYHIAARLNYSTGSLDIFINGVLSNSLAIAGWIGNTSNTPSLVANYAANGAVSNTFDGILDDARVYNRSLTNQEINNVYSARGRDSIVYGLIHRWTCNEAVTGTSANGANTVKDKILDADGTPTNTPTYTSDFATHRKKRI